MITKLGVSKTPAVISYVIGNVIFSEFPSSPIHFSCAMITILGVVLRLYPALIPARGKRCYSFKIVWTGFGDHSYSLLSGFTGFFPGVKRARFEAYHLLPSSAEDKKVCGTSLPLSTCALTECTRTTLYLLLPRTRSQEQLYTYFYRVHVHKNNFILTFTAYTCTRTTLYLLLPRTRAQEQLYTYFYRAHVHKNNFIFTFTAYTCTRTTLYLLLRHTGDRNSVFGRESHYRLNDPAFEPRWGKKLFLLDTLSDQPWGSPSILYDGERGPLPDLALTTHYHLAPKLKMSRNVLLFPLCTCVACYGFTFTIYYEVLMHNAFCFRSCWSIRQPSGFYCAE